MEMMGMTLEIRYSCRRRRRRAQKKKNPLLYRYHPSHHTNTLVTSFAFLKTTTMMITDIAIVLEVE